MKRIIAALMAFALVFGLFTGFGVRGTALAAGEEDRIEVTDMKGRTVTLMAEPVTGERDYTARLSVDVPAVGK